MSKIPKKTPPAFDVFTTLCLSNVRVGKAASGKQYDVTNCTYFALPLPPLGMIISAIFLAVCGAFVPGGNCSECR